MRRIDTYGLRLWGSGDWRGAIATYCCARGKGCYTLLGRIERRGEVMGFGCLDDYDFLFDELCVSKCYNKYHCNFVRMVLYFNASFEEKPKTSLLGPFPIGPPAVRCQSNITITRAKQTPQPALTAENKPARLKTPNGISRSNQALSKSATPGETEGTPYTLRQRPEKSKASKS